MHSLASNKYSPHTYQKHKVHVIKSKITFKEMLEP